MGYRSEVKSLIYGEPATMAKFLEDNAELVDAVREDFGSDLDTYHKSKQTLLFLDMPYVKWYSSDAGVIRWHNLLSLANEAELMFEFVRIGEDSEGDIEQEYSQTECDYYLEVVTAIKANF
jgi:hypothetical protein